MHFVLNDTLLSAAEVLLDNKASLALIPCLKVSPSFPTNFSLAFKASSSVFLSSNFANTGCPDFSMSKKTVVVR